MVFYLIVAGKMQTKETAYKMPAPVSGATRIKPEGLSYKTTFYKKLGLMGGRCPSFHTFIARDHRREPQRFYLLIQGTQLIHQLPVLILHDQFLEISP